MGSKGVLNLQILAATIPQFRQHIHRHIGIRNVSSAGPDRQPDFVEGRPGGHP